MRHIALTAALCSLLAGCATAKITTEFDQTRDFTAFKTYAWLPEAPGPEQASAIRNPAVYALVKAAVDRELLRRGLTLATTGAPDLFVAAHGMARDRIEVQPYGYTYAPYSYGYYPTAMAVGAEVRQYRDGTLIVDLVDAKTKQLAWRGTASDTVSDPSQVAGVVDAAMKQLMAEYPPRNTKAK